MALVETDRGRGDSRRAEPFVIRRDQGRASLELLTAVGREVVADRV